MSSLSITPSFNYDAEVLGHNLSLSANFTENKDLSKFATGQTDVKTMALGLSYNMGIKPWDVDVTCSYSHQKSSGFKSVYLSDVLSVGTGRSFLKENNLNVSVSVSMYYNEVVRQSKSLSLGCDFTASYNLKKVHMFSASAGFNKYGDVNITKTRSNLDQLDITASLNYVYTFTLLSIKSKANRQKEKNEQQAKKM